MNRRLSLVFIAVLIMSVGVLLFLVRSKDNNGRTVVKQTGAGGFVRNQNSESKSETIRSRSFSIKEVSISSCGEASIGWQSVSESGVEYDLLRMGGIPGALTRVAVIRQNDPSSCGESFCSYTDKTILPRVEYAYSIRARGNNWTSMNDSRDCDATQSNPCSVSVKSSACEMGPIHVDEDVCSSVHLEWKLLLETVSYRVYRKMGKQRGFEKIAEVNSFQFEDRDVVVDQEYEYSISPVYVWGEEGDRSKPIVVTTSCPDRKWEKR